MAKSKTKKDKNAPRFNYTEELRKLKEQGPERMYFIWGPEDYLSGCFVDEIRKICVPEGVADFSYHKFGDRDFSARALADAIDSVPFLTERTMVEVKGIDLNKLKEDEVEELLEALADIPDYCTVVFSEPSEFEPDKRKKIYKKLPKCCSELYVNSQTPDALINWVIRRFGAEGKRIDLNAVQRLIFVSGDLMNKLIPEINKIVSYSKGSLVTVADVDAVAHHIPESVVFEMTECLGNGEIGKAMFLLDELLASKECDEFVIVAVLGNQMRKLYGAKMALECGQGKDYLKNYCGVNFDFQANKLLTAANRFNAGQLRRAVELCAETDYKIKSSRTDPKELLKECVMRIAAGESDV